MYSLDRRKIALHMYSILNSLRKVASLLSVHFSTVSRWIKNIERKSYTLKDRTHLKAEIVRDLIKGTIHANPFMSIRKLKTQIFDALQISVSYELIRCVIKNLGLSKKKAKFFSAPKLLPQKVKDFLEARERFKILDKRFVSIDETSFGRNYCETRGFAPKGAPLYWQRNKPRVTSVSVLAASTKSGWLKISKQEKAFNTTSFLTFIKDLNLTQDHVVLIDNVRFHHSKVVKDFFAERNINVLYTPPYSPWFNPIELCFSIVKRQYPVLQEIQASFDSVKLSHFEVFFDKSLRCLDKY